MRSHSPFIWCRPIKTSHQFKGDVIFYPIRQSVVAVWICNDELKQVVRYLTPRMALNLFKVLGEEFQEGDDPFRALCKWRDYGTPNYPGQQREQLHSALDRVNYCGMN